MFENEPEDIFNEVEPTHLVKSGARPSDSISSLDNHFASGEAPSQTAPILRWIFLVGGGIVVIGLLIFTFKNIFPRPTAVPENIARPAAITPPASPPPEESEIPPGSQADLPNASPEIVRPENNPSAAAPLIDSDQDGLSDEEEKKLGTDSNNPDTDGDELSDFEEKTVWGTDPKNPDTDGDSYQDGFEVKNSYNPKGSGKLVEAKNSAPPAKGPQDSDQDGLTDEEESKFGTDSANPDTDGDGHQDGEEVQNGYNPKGPGKL